MAQVASGTMPLGGDQSLNAALEVQNYLKARLTAKNSSSSTSSKWTIPVIDISSSFSGSLTDRKAVASQIHTACTETGFFYITGHGISATTCTETLKLAERFFHELTQQQKEEIHMKNSKHFRGYEPSTYSQVNDLDGIETKEVFNWGYEAGLDPSGGDGKYVEIDGASDGSKNQWPKEEDLPGFYAGIAEYYGRVSTLDRRHKKNMTDQDMEQCLELSRHLFRLFAISLDLEESYFDHLVTHPGAIARLINYPPAKKPSSLPNDDDEIGLGAHTDYECFTLLLQSPTPALEILSPDGDWIPVNPVEGGIVINIADFLMRWTNGKYKSTVHRVVNRTGEQRYSVPFFFSINYDDMVETLPGCLKEGEVSPYPPITAGKYVYERLGLTVKM